MELIAASDLVARVLAGDELITGNDADGTYVKVDALEIDYPGQKVRFLSRGKPLLQLPVPALALDNVLYLSDLEIRVRVMITDG